MRKKGWGFICFGHKGWIFFFNKDTKKIVFARNIGKGEYLPKRAVRLKKKFPLNQATRDELTARIRNEQRLLNQKT